MTLVKYDPMRGFGNLTRRFNPIGNVFDQGFGLETGDFMPRVDISETDKQLHIQVEMPGLSKDDFKLSVNDDNVLSLKGSKKRESEDKKEDGGITYHRIERTCGEFVRSFTLPNYVKSDSISAKFENGVLNITFDKVEPTLPKEIPISIS